MSYEHSKGIKLCSRIKLNKSMWCVYKATDLLQRAGQKNSNILLNFGINCSIYCVMRFRIFFSLYVLFIADAKASLHYSRSMGNIS